MLLSVASPCRAQQPMGRVNGPHWGAHRQSCRWGRHQRRCWESSPRGRCTNSFPARRSHMCPPHRGSAARGCTRRLHRQRGKAEQRGKAGREGRAQRGMHLEYGAPINCWCWCTCYDHKGHQRRQVATKGALDWSLKEPPATKWQQTQQIVLARQPKRSLKMRPASGRARAGGGQCPLGHRGLTRCTGLRDASASARQRDRDRVVDGHKPPQSGP